MIGPYTHTTNDFKMTSGNDLITAELFLCVVSIKTCACAMQDICVVYSFSKEAITRSRKPHLPKHILEVKPYRR